MASQETNDNRSGNIDVEIAVIKTNLQQIGTIVSEFKDIAKDMAENTSELRRILTDHEYKFKQQERFLEKIQNDAEMRRRESENSVRELKNQMAQSFTDSVNRDAEAFEKISLQIREMEIAHEKAIEKVYNAIEVNKNKNEDAISSLEKRVSKLETKWYYFTGIAAVLVFIANKIPWASFF